MSIEKTTPWKGDIAAAFYDRIMIKSVFPRKFRTDFEKHTELLSEVLSPLHSKDIIEIGTGSGISADFLSVDNNYSGVDISPRLLKRAAKRFARKGFRCGESGNASFHRTSAESLPFDETSYDYGICLLTLNFIPDARRCLLELKRVLRPESTAFFSVPCRGLLNEDTGIRGTVLSKEELERLFVQCGFSIRILDQRGALLYFEAGNSPESMHEGCP